MPFPRKTCAPGTATKLARVQAELDTMRERHASVVRNNHNVSKRFYDYRADAKSFVACVNELKLHPQQNPELLARLASLGKTLVRPYNPTQP